MSSLITVSAGKMMVSSKQVADHFGKIHRNVMRDIKSLIESAGSEFGSDNFEQSSYISLQNKQLPCYMMTRDGFSLLAMGFTGKPAILWKVKYIQAFNEMEYELSQGVSVMQSINEAMRLMDQDKQIASVCGKGLHEWKKQRTQHMEKVEQLHRDAQLLLGFEINAGNDS